MNKKLMTAMAVMVLGISAFAAGPVYSDEFNITATQTVYTNYVTFGTGEWKDVLKLKIKNITAVTATTVTAIDDGDVWTTISTDAVTAGSSTVVYPSRTYSQVEINSSGVTNTVSAVAAYPAYKLRLITTLAGTNGAAVANGITFNVYAK